MFCAAPRSDHRGVPGQTASPAPHPGPSRGWSVAISGVALAIGVLTVLVPQGAGGSPGPVVLSQLHDVRVVRGGESHVPAEGEQLRGGDRVITGPNGGAVMSVGRRRVVLDRVTEVVVPDGGVVSIARGSMLVDRRSGPGISVVAGEVSLDRIDPGALRVDRGYSVRVSVYSGQVRATTSSGRSLDIPGLFHVDAPGRALPTVPAPLALTGHRWEQEILPAVVADDVALTALARGIDGTERLRTVSSALKVLPATYAPAPGFLDPVAGGSELLLARAIGDTAQRTAVGSDGTTTAIGLRRAGASWGVVVALLNTSRASIAARLADLLDAANALPAEAPLPPVGSVLAGGPVRVPTPGSSAAAPRPGATKAPLPNPGPDVSVATDPVETVVGTVRELLPTPVDGLLSPLLDPVQGLLEPLLGGGSATPPG